MSRKRHHNDSGKLFPKKVCAFCGISEDNEVLYGKFIVLDDMCVHMNCVFFASGLYQRGEETEGLSGFLLPDIERELSRGKKLFCAYCRKRGATIGCSEVKCKKSFHLNCGLERGVLCQYFGSFRVFCKEHSPRQKPRKITEELFCFICCEDILRRDLHSCLYSPCCKKWFHKICIQKYALSAGLYFFKCPLCNNSEEFVKEMEFYGICIPDRDASWELEENAYRDHYFRPGCDVDNCLCPNGRKFSSNEPGDWKLLTCSHCGSHARHRNCGNIKMTEDTWLCEECKWVEKKADENKASGPPVEEFQGPSTSHQEKEKDSSVVSKFNKTLKLCIRNVNNCSDDSNSKPQTANISHFSNVLKSKQNKIEEMYEIKNIALDCLLVKPCTTYKTHTTKKATKKRRIDSSCCGGNHNCIKKYFGQECGKFRI